MLPTTNSRNQDLDIVKGMLVLVMIVWHGTYVLCAQEYSSLGHAIQDRVEFIHYAFIIISGYLCGWYYSPRLEIAENHVRRRLVVRAIKLYLVVFFSTLALYLAGVVYSFQVLAARINSFQAFLNNFIIDVNGNLIVFELVLYIAVLLLLASVILGRLWVTLLSCMSLIILLFNSASGLIFFLSLGMVGILLGVLSSRGFFENLWAFAERTQGAPLIFLFLLYQFLLPEVRALTKGTSPVQAIRFLSETVLWFGFFVFLFRRIGQGRLEAAIVRIGRYTLVGYMAQVAIVRGAYLLLTKAGIQEVTLIHYLVVCMFTTAAVYFLIVELHSLRTRFNLVDRAYTSVFA